MELQSETEIIIAGYRTFWTESCESVIIEGTNIPVLLCRWHSMTNTPVAYITKFSLEKVIGKGKAKNRLKKWEKNTEYISFDQPRGKNAQICTLISDSMKSLNCPKSGTLLLVRKVKDVFSKELQMSERNEDDRPTKKLCLQEIKEWKRYEVLFEGIEFEKLPEPGIYQREGPFLVCMWYDSRIYCSLLPWKTVYIEKRVGGNSSAVLSSYTYENEYHDGIQKLVSLLLSEQ